MRTIKFIFLLFFLYIYLYNPILKLLGFGTIKIVLLISIVYLFFNKGFISILLNFKKEALFTLILIFYSFIITFFGDGTAKFVPYQHFTWFIESFFISAFILFYFQDLFERYSFESLIVIVGTIASMITLYLIVNPSVNMWLRDSVLIDALDTTDYEFTLRGFTFAETSSFAYGIIQGLILAFCLNSLKKSVLYAIPIIPLFISILFNARIGFVPVIISVVLLVLYNRLKFRYVLVGISLFLISTVFIQNSSFVKENQDSFEWGLGFFKDTFSAVSGDTSGSNYDVLLNDMIVFPTSFIGVVFGEGRSAYGISVNDSDIGYINELLIGGLIYLSIIMLFMYYLYRRNLIYAYDNYYTLLFIFVLLVANIKGVALFVPNGFFRLFVLFYIYSIYFTNKDIEQSEIK